MQEANLPDADRVVLAQWGWLGLGFLGLEQRWRQPKWPGPVLNPGDGPFAPHQR